MLYVPGVTGLLAYVLRRPHVTVALPVSPPVWSRWRRRVVLSQGAVTFGTVLLAAGSIAPAAAAALAAGVVIVVSGIVLWARANRNWWVTCVFDPTRDTVTVEPTHSKFDTAARDIFIHSIR